MIQSDLKVCEENIAANPEPTPDLQVVKNALIDAFSQMDCKDID